MIQILDNILTKQAIKQFRTKQLLMFLTGYTISQLYNIGKSIHQQFKLNVQVNTNIHFILQQINNNNLYITRQQLYDVYCTALSVVKQNYICRKIVQTYHHIYDQFVQLILIGLKQIQYSNSLQQLKTKLSSKLSQIVQKQIIKLNYQKYQIKSTQQYQQSIKINTLTKLIDKQNKQEHQTQYIIQCQICCIEIKANETIKLQQCGHEYHINCMYKTITNYLNQNSSIISLNNKQLIQSNNSHKSLNNSINNTPTLIKCPNFQYCSKFLSFQSIHNILLTTKSLYSNPKQQQQSFKNTSFYLDKLYSIAFNDYLNYNHIKPFKQIFKSFNQQLKQSSQSNQTSQHLFFCHTKGCNAIYSIDNQLIKKNIQNIKTDYQHFVCISCKEPYCLKCFSQLHPTMTCKQFAISSNYLPQDRQLQKFIKTLRRPYMKCPKCHFYVDNWRGCSTITCRCGIRFCYKCGSTQCPYAKCLKQMEKQRLKQLERQRQKQK